MEESFPTHSLWIRRQADAPCGVCDLVNEMVKCLKARMHVALSVLAVGLVRKFGKPPILPSKCYSVKIIIYLGLFTMLDHSTARVSHSHGPAAIPQGKARALYHRCCPSTVHVLTFAVPPRPHF